MYTTPAPRASIVQSPVPITPSSPSATGSPISTATTVPIGVRTSSTYTSDPPRSVSPADSHISSSHTVDEIHEEHSTPPLAVEKAVTGSIVSAQRGESVVVEEKQTPYNQEMRSPVLEDTLSDIEEAITDISNSRQRRASGRRHSSIQAVVPTRALTPAEEVIEDSSSEYSRQEEIVSNSNSEFEDDEEEEEEDEVEEPVGDSDANDYTEAVIKAWTPHQVAQYLQGRNIPLTTCQKFEEEEVTGATLLQLEMFHLKELEIGSFGKRFEVWKEIENLVKKAKTAVPMKHRSGSDVRLSTASPVRDSPPRQRSSTVTGTVLPRIPSQHNRAISRQHKIINVQDANMLDVTVPGHGPLHTPMTGITIPSQVSITPPSTVAGVFEAPRSPPISPQRAVDAGANYRRTSGTKRLSGHDFSPATALNAALSAGAAILSAGGTDGASHQRGGSFDRNWQISSVGARPSTGSQKSEYGHKMSTSVGTGDTVFTGDSGFSGSQPHTPKVNATERSYFSSGESTPRERKVLQKKNSGSQARKSSYTEEQRLRSATAHSRQSRIGSASSIETTNRKPSPIFTAAQAYHARGSSKDKTKRMSASFSGAPEGFPYDAPKLSPTPSTKAPGPQKRTDDDMVIGCEISPSTPPPPLPNARSVSEQLLPMGEDGARSIDSLDGSTPSITATVESDPLCGTPERPPKAERSMTTPTSGRRVRGVSSGSALRQKSKKHNTSAWEKGLREISPQEAAEEADFSGWMKKRGSSGIGVWKRRFFVLQGRRLAYFYSDKDTKERGLIDITSHRVLPATEDRLVSLHASFAAATSPSSSPAISTSTSPQPPATANSVDSQQLPTSPPGSLKEKEKEKEKDKPKEGEKDKGWFTFKLVPPAPGATKGVTFTPPRLHYFATDTREEGKKWMGAIMKATIDRDESKPVISSYNAKTISLAKARQLRARPPDMLKGGGDSVNAALLSAGLAISGVDMGVGEEGEEADEDEGEEEDADAEDERDEVLERLDSGPGEPRVMETVQRTRTRSSSGMTKDRGAMVTALGIIA